MFPFSFISPHPIAIPILNSLQSLAHLHPNTPFPPTERKEERSEPTPSGLLSPQKNLNLNLLSDLKASLRIDVNSDYSRSSLGTEKDRTNTKGLSEMKTKTEIGSNLKPYFELGKIAVRPLLLETDSETDSRTDSRTKQNLNTNSNAKTEINSVTKFTPKFVNSSKLFTSADRELLDRIRSQEARGGHIEKRLKR